MLVHLVNDAAADIIPGDEPIHSNLFLDAQVPLVDVGRFRILRDNRVGARRWEYHVFAENNRDRISAGISLPRIVKTPKRIRKLNQAASWGRVADSTNTLEVRVVKKHAVSRTNHGHAISLGIEG